LTAEVITFGIVGGILLLYLGLAAKGRRFTHLPVAKGRVVAIIPTYNEDPDTLHAAIRALLSGTVTPDVIHVVDDGSRVPAPVFLHPKVRWHRQPNAGKRHAQVTGLRGEHADFVLTVDSDSIAYSTALEETLRAMSDPRVQAVTATTVVRNRVANLLTRITDVEVVTGNFVMRRARSVLGAVAPTSGPFALYRSPVFFDNVADYLASGTYSDDRRLTHYALLRGQVVACDEAVVEMVMPESAGEMFRQRTRWFQGYFRYLRWELVNLSGAVLLMRVWSLILLISYPLIMVFAVVVLPVTAGFLYWEAWGYWLLILYAQTLHYLVSRPGLSLRSRFLAWVFLTPLVFAVQTAVVRPAMYYATTRVRRDGWGTRLT
jgi:hyaluronan synthase